MHTKRIYFIKPMIIGTSNLNACTCFICFQHPNRVSVCLSPLGHTSLAANKSLTLSSKYYTKIDRTCESLLNSGNTRKKVSFYIAQYPILRIAQSTLHFTSLADLFNQTPSQLLWEASSHMQQLMREDCSYTYPPLVCSQVLIDTAE